MSNKSILSATLLLASTIIANADTKWLVEYKEYSVDTTYHATVGPGTTLTHLDVNGPTGLNHLFYTEIDLGNPWIEMRSAKAKNNMRAVETVPDIAARFDAPGQRYFAGVNADFFNTGYPYNSLGACISNGQLTNRQTTGPSADIDDYYLCFDSNGVPQFSRHVTLATSGSVSFRGNNSYPCSINAERTSNGLVIYTPQWQYINYGVTHPAGHTGTNEWGYEVAVRLVDGERTFWGHTASLEVISDVEKNVGNMEIPLDGFVLSGHGTSGALVSDLKKGDVIKVFFDFKANDATFDAREVIGGFPYLLYAGTVQATPGYPEHLANPEPRTAVGYNDDKTRMIMLVVDGRKAGGSAGATQQQLAWFMKNLGCTYAMNFDGGGSSTMYVDRLGIRNVPSSSSLDADRKEGEPRVVVNALFAVSTSPDDNEVAAIEIVDKHLDLTTGQSYTPTVYGYNRYGVLIDKNLSGYKCNVSPMIADVNDNNTLKAADGHYSGLLTVTYGDATHSIPVYLNGGGEFVNASVDNIIADDNFDAPTMYYNLQGIRVDNPAPGSFYIEKRGSSIRKIQL